ncbi:hypothetical protein RvY_11158 [Ramazzottius varieornatus]|uniref:Uncharacterized protein n=1 Tax=Ramazzottius varieornatus TaxID=947166 RepID=A0A1D1VMZ2_RAMVA|nr:hypothetical protein RvY_11158 [Ramazzottius varieornatus]
MFHPRRQAYSRGVQAIGRAVEGPIRFEYHPGRTLMETVTRHVASTRTLALKNPAARQK